MKRCVVVIDGMGGGVGAQLIERLKAQVGDRVEVWALGTNSGATDRMLKAGADRGASGENAIRVSAARGELILGPIGIVLANGMLGEITPTMAEAVLGAPCGRILVPVPQEHFTLAGFEQKPLGKLIEDACTLAMERLGMVK